MTNEEFLGYVELHSRTERALFAGEHLDRLLALAGRPPIRWGCSQIGPRPALISIHHHVAAPLLEEARLRLRSAE